MTPPKYSLLTFLVLIAANSLPAAEITGKVRDASGGMATVAIEGDALPSIGDTVEISFKLAGAGEDILVADGKVAAVEGKVIRVKIENATGTVAKDQLVRIKPSSVAKAPGQSPPSASSPSGTAATTNPSIVGTWVGTYGNGTKYSFTFKADQTVIFTVDEKGAASDARVQATLRGKYRVDSTAKPNRMVLFDLDSHVRQGETLDWPFEVLGNSQFKMDLSQGASEHPEKGFTGMATIFSREP